MGLVKKEVITATKVSHVKPPPLPPRTSPFNTMQEWLFSICDSEKPERSFDTYHFRLLGSGKSYTVWFYGTNAEQQQQQGSSDQPHFTTSRYPLYDLAEQTAFNPLRYYPLKKSEFIALKKEQILDKITSELKAFTNTDKFKNSFFAKAKAIIGDFNGKTIWQRNF